MTYSKYKRYKMLYDKNGTAYIIKDKTRININDIIITDSEKNYVYISTGYNNNLLYHLKMEYGINDYILLRPLF